MTTLTHQLAADAIKSLADTLPPAERRRALAIVAQFERAPWHPDAWADALRMAPGVRADGAALAWRTGPSFEASASTINLYFALMMYIPPCPGDAGDILTTREAADFLGVTIDAVYKWVYRDKVLVPFDSVGRAKRFLRADLEAFQRARNARSLSASRRGQIDDSEPGQ